MVISIKQAAIERAKRRLADAMPATHATDPRVIALRRAVRHMDAIVDAHKAAEALQ